MSATGPGPLDLSKIKAELAKAGATDAGAVLPFRAKTERGKAPIGFKLCAAAGAPLYVLLAVDPSIPDDAGVVVATGPLSAMPLIERILLDAQGNLTAAGHQ